MELSRYLHVKQIIHSLVQIVLLQSNANGDFGARVERLPLNPSRAVGIPFLMDYVRASWCRNSPSQKAVENNQTDLHIACVSLAKDFVLVGYSSQ